MRQLGEFDNMNMARVFSDVLTGSRIENQLRDESTTTEHVFEIWVKWEDDMPKAEQLLSEYLANPEDSKYQDLSRDAKKINREKQAEEKDFAPRVDVRTEIFNQSLPPRGAFTMILVLICVVVGVLSNLGEKLGSIHMLFITDFVKEGNMVHWNPGLEKVLSGEIWRLITPIFIHFGFMHLLFNMLWLIDLGSMIEHHKGTLFLILFIVVIASASNYGQYILGNHPVFGGMSGVVYGLLGYIWMKGKYDPASKLRIHGPTVVFMMIWYFLCLTGLMGNIANGAHTVGLVLGVIWGYLTSFKARRLIDK